MITVRPGRDSAPDIAEAVLGVAAPERARRLPLGILAALLAHAVFMLGAHRTARDAGAAARAAPRVSVEIDLTPRSAPPPLQEHPATAPTPRTASAHTRRSSPAPAAQAASVIARSPDSDGPVDLTADAVVTGNATAYAGGVTASTGTSSAPVAEAPSPPRPPAPIADHASPVSLASEDWSCPWPAEADAEQIDEQTVILRVVVSASGDPRSARVLADPGHGFGAAALACALRTHFTPALDAAGKAIPATSPPIRVRFTR